MGKNLQEFKKFDKEKMKILKDLYEKSCEYCDETTAEQSFDIMCKYENIDKKTSDWARKYMTTLHALDCGVPMRVIEGNITPSMLWWK